MKCHLCGSSRVVSKYTLPEFNVNRCLDCTLVFLQNQPDDQRLSALYSGDYFQERTEYFFNNIIADDKHGKRDANIRQFSQGLETLAARKPGKGLLLDVGCGPGIFLEMARREGWQVSGADISPFAAGYAKEKFGITVHVGAALADLNLPAASFDAVTLWDALEHFPDPLGQLKEINRLLKNDGLIILNIPNEDALLRVMARFLYLVSLKQFRYPVRKLYHEFHLNYFSVTAIKVLLKLADLEPLTIKRNTIPIVKARGRNVEKILIKWLSHIEKLMGMEFELLIMAGKKG